MAPHEKRKNPAPQQEGQGNERDTKLGGQFQNQLLSLANARIVCRSQDAVKLTFETRLGLCIVLHVALNGVVSLPSGYAVVSHG